MRFYRLLKEQVLIPLISQTGLLAVGRVLVLWIHCLPERWWYRDPSSWAQASLDPSAA